MAVLSPRRPIPFRRLRLALTDPTNQDLPTGVPGPGFLGEHGLRGTLRRRIPVSLVFKTGYMVAGSVSRSSHFVTSQSLCYGVRAYRQGASQSAVINRSKTQVIVSLLYMTVIWF